MAEKITTEELLALSDIEQSGPNATKQLSDLANKFDLDDKKNTGFNDLYGSFTSQQFNFENRDSLLMDFFKKLFGLENKSDYLDIEESEFISRFDQKRNMVDFGDEVPENLQSVATSPSQENNLLQYKDNLVQSAVSQNLEGFDNEELLNKIKFKEEGGKFKVVLPKELFESYSQYRASCAVNGQEDEIISGLRKVISNNKGGVENEAEEVKTQISDLTDNSEDNEPPKPWQERISEVGFDGLNFIRQANSSELAVSGRRQREALLNNRSYSIADEEAAYNRHTAIVGIEESPEGHYNKQITGQNKLIQRWADKNGNSEELEDLLSNDKRFDKVEGLDALCEQNPSLKTLVDERNRLVGLREERISESKDIAENQLEYARAKTTEQYHQASYDNAAKSLEDAVIAQGNLAHYFSFNKHKDRFGSIEKEIEQLSSDNKLDLSVKGLQKAVDRAYDNMSVEDKASMHKVDIFKVKLDSKMLSSASDKGADDQVMLYAQKMPKVFSAILSQKVGSEIGEEGNGVSDMNQILNTMAEHSDPLKEAKKSREEIRSEKDFKNRGNIGTRIGGAISDAAAEFSSGVENNSRIAGQKTVNAVAAAGKAIDNKVDEMATSYQNFSDSVGRKVTESIDAAADYTHEKTGGKFHADIEKQKQDIIERLKGSIRGDDKTASVSANSSVKEVKEALKENEGLQPDGSLEVPQKGNSGHSL